MAYRVEFAVRAARDLDLLYVEKNAAESKAAARWLGDLEEAVLRLANHPHRCPPAPEGKRLKRRLRHMLYGNKPHIYRVIYEVDEQRNTVWVLHIAISQEGP